LPKLIHAATAGVPTVLSRDDDHALLTTPYAAAAQGWDLADATVHGIADGRKKLGDLIHEAAQGHPQVLRRHTTPVAVLLPAANGSPHPAVSGPVAPAPTPDQAAPAGTTPAPAAAANGAPAPAAASGTTAGSTPARTSSPTPSPAPTASPAHTVGAAAPLPGTTATTAPAALQRGAPTTPHPAANPTPAPAPAPAAPPRRLAPLGQALTTILTPAATDTSPGQADSTAPAGPRGVPTGLRSLDHALGGLQPGRFYLVAAAPGTGGSLLAATAARTAALDYHLPVLYAASGLTRTDIAARITAAHLPVDYRRLRAGRLTETEQADIAALHDELAAAPLFIDDNPGLTPTAIAETATALAQEPGQPPLALIVVDRLQAADDPRLPLSGPRLTDAAQALVHLARTHHLPVLAALDTTSPALITALGLDVTLTLTPEPSGYVRLTVTERDLGPQSTFTLNADRTHARLTDPPDRPASAGFAPDPVFTVTEQEAASSPSAWPPVTVPGHPTPAPVTPAAPHLPDQLGGPGPVTAPDNTADTAPTAAAVSVPTRAAASSVPAAAPRRALGLPATADTGKTYGNRDYTHFTDQITRAVDQALTEHGGDVEAATEALVKKAVPNAMALFEETRVGATYDHTVYPNLPEFLRKRTKDGADQIWEGRHNWSNTHLLDQLNNDAMPPITVDVLDTNAAFLAAFKAHLPIGTLAHDPTGGFDPKRSGIYLLPQRPAWDNPDLPDPIGNRYEPGPVLLTDATIRLLIRCARNGLCETPKIAESWTSGASEGLLEKFRRVLTEARHHALTRQNAGYADGAVAVEYIKAMYAKFTSTMGESSANRSIRRPEWMHIIRSQAFANLWRKAYRARTGGLTLVRVRGTDELHITGGQWRKTTDGEGGVFEEGRLLTHMKLKDQYTLPRKPAA
jgi:prevent-host-death family protein